MNLYVGTSGYSYREWKGTFYPENLPARQMLHFYGACFRTVEINSTFNGTPKASVVEAWAEAVRSDFKFAIKAPRQITHLKRLKDSGDLVSTFLQAVGALSKRQGPVLFQLPPTSKKDVPRLQAFLTLLPKRRSAAFEFRRPSWFDDEVLGLLPITARHCVLPTLRATSKFPLRRPRIGAICACGGPIIATRN